jgi:hypothetical protein
MEILKLIRRILAICTYFFEIGHKLGKSIFIVK